MTKEPTQMERLSAAIARDKARRASAQQAQVVAPAPVVSTRPAVVQSRIVVLRKREDGTVLERPGPPPFMFQDPKSAVGKVNLPPGYYWRGSSEHLAKLAELKDQGAK